jgi:hypothetical protein
MYTNRKDSREEVPAQKIGTSAELVNSTHENDGKLEHFMAQLN